MSYCGNCGLKLNESLNFCPKCGIKVNKSPSLNEKIDYKTQNNTSLNDIVTPITNTLTLPQNSGQEVKPMINRKERKSWDKEEFLPRNLRKRQ